MSSLKNLISLILAILLVSILTSGCATKHYVPRYTPQDVTWVNTPEARLQFCELSRNWNRVQVEYRTISPPNAAGMFGGVGEGDTDTVAAEKLNSSNPSAVTASEGCPAVLASDLMKVGGRVDMGATQRTYHFRVYPHPEARRLIHKEKPEAKVEDAVAKQEALLKKCKALVDQGKRLPKACLAL